MSFRVFSLAPGKMPKCLKVYCPWNRNTKKHRWKLIFWVTFQVKPIDLSQISWFWYKSSLKDCLHARAELAVNTNWRRQWQKHNDDVRVHKSSLTTNKMCQACLRWGFLQPAVCRMCLHGCSVSLGLWCSSSSLVLGQRQQRTVWFTPAAPAWALFL